MCEPADNFAIVIPPDEHRRWGSNQRVFPIAEIVPTAVAELIAIVPPTDFNKTISCHPNWCFDCRLISLGLFLFFTVIVFIVGFVLLVRREA